jgi:hypothetical protein
VSTTTINDGKFEDYISVAKAARIVGTTTQAMSNLVRKGSFTRKIVAGRTLVLRSEVESYVPRLKGRPTKEMQTGTKPLKKPLETIDRRNSGKYISQAEAARIRGVSKQAIANLINRGRLGSVSIAGRILVIRYEVEAFLPQSVGRPPKKSASKKATKIKRKR